MRLTVFLIVVSLLGQSTNAANYKTGMVYNSILTIGGTRISGQAGDCSRTWYDPEVYAVNNSAELRLLGQGNNPTDSCGTAGYDALYRGIRNPVNGIWSVPSTTDCTALVGFPKCGRPKWVWASPSVVTNVSPTDSRYFMAFVGGNGDFDKGKIYWAVSNDGLSWSVYSTNPPAGEPWSPVMYPKYGADCFVPFGVGQVALAFENGYFYIFMNYIHRVSYMGSPEQTWESMAFRFSYNPGHSYGFGSIKQIYYDPDGPTTPTGGSGPGSWVTHSGRFVFNYDAQPAEPGDPVLGYFTSMWSLHNGGKDIKRDPSRSRWIHAFTAADTQHLHWQENSSLATNTWSDRFDIDTQTLDAKFPGRTVQYPGLFYGSVGGAPAKMYIFVPVDWGSSACQVPGAAPTFSGLGIASAELLYQ